MSTVLEVIALLELLAAWLLVCLRYQHLPAMIRSPFNGGGDIYGMAGKEQLWLLLVISGFLYLLLTGIPRIPELPVNAPGQTNPKTIARVRRAASALLLRSKVLVMCMFLILTIFSTGMAGSSSTHLALFLLAVALLMLVVVFVVRLFQTAPLER